MSALRSFAVVAAVAASLLSGCAASYSHEEITDVSAGGDLPAPTVSLQAIRVYEGTLVTAHVIPYNSDQNPMVGVVESDAPGVLGVTRALDNKWAFYGVKAGHARVTLTADGDPVAVIDAEVVAQP